MDRDRCALHSGHPGGGPPGEGVFLASARPITRLRSPAPGAAACHAGTGRRPQPRASACGCNNTGRERRRRRRLERVEKVFSPHGLDVWDTSDVRARRVPVSRQRPRSSLVRPELPPTNERRSCLHRPTSCSAAIVCRLGRRSQALAPERSHAAARGREPAPAPAPAPAPMSRPRTCPPAD